MTITENCPPAAAQSIRESLAKMKHCGLDYDMVDHCTTEARPDDLITAGGGATAPKGGLVAAIDLVSYALANANKKYSDMQVCLSNMILLCLSV